MKIFKTHRKLAVATLAFVVVAVTGGAAFAYFTSTGSGTGSAKTGTSNNVTISQIGAGYDSLISNGGYTQDQCFACDGPNELGNSISLSSPDASQLTTVVVAIDNWGAAETGVPMTLTISNTVDGAISDTQDFSLNPAINIGTDPSVNNVVFDFSSQDAFVESPFVYGITFNTTAGAPPVAAADSLNVALSSSTTDISTGSDTTAGNIWLDDTFGNNNDFPTCTNNAALSAGVFEAVAVDCGPYNPSNPGAYGNEVPTDDIPAVEVNVVGGDVEGLFPGDSAQPIEFAITNTGTGNVQVASVSVALDTSGADVATPALADIPGCLSAWYQINNSPQALGPSAGSIPPGTTIFTTTSPTASDLSIQMLNPATSQDACELADIGLKFSSN
jgi:hypothetical protein